jgi:hypothetical protein
MHVASVKITIRTSSTNDAHRGALFDPRIIDGPRIRTLQGFVRPLALEDEQSSRRER